MTPEVSEREQLEAAREDWAFAELQDRVLLEATGPLRQKLLHDVLSNDVELPAGSGSRAALMDVKGHLEVVLRVSVANDRVVLEMPSDRLDVVEESLIRYRVGAPVRFARPDVGLLAVVGPRAGERLASLGLPPPEAAPESHVEASLEGATVRVVRAGDLPAKGLVLHVSREKLDGVRDQLTGAGARRLGRSALDVLRIEDGKPWYGPDISHDHLLHETGLLKELHSFSKGCYVGQEVVARLEGRGGHVNRQLRGLKLGAPAAPGDEIRLDERAVGAITTAGISPRLGPIAMGYVHRSAFEPGTQVRVGEAAAEVVSLPVLDAA